VTASTAQLEWVKTQAPLMSIPADETPEEAKYPDMKTDVAMWKSAGLGLGEEASYLLVLSLKALAVANSGEVRFWGKLVTRSGDYFVAEMATTEFPEDNDIFLMEGTDGPNKYTYYVTKSPAGAGSWTVLPNVTTAQIVASRQIKRFLTGNLEASVQSFPPFPGGLESNLVRAIIAQITSETVLSLDGLLKPGDDDEVAAIVPNDEIEDGFTKSVDDLKDMGTWVHAELDINTVGRTQKTPLPVGDDGEPIEPDEPDEAPKAPLGSIAEDVEGDKPLWVLRSCPGAAGISTFSVVAAKSLKWPGAVSVAAGKKITSVYMGFGYPKSSTIYQPPAPKLVLKEWAVSEEEESPGGVPLEKDDITIKPEEPEE
jgi:radial spoke head protein 4A